VGVLARYRELAAKVDAFFARAHARHAGDMRCRAGCFDCCLTEPTLTGVEAAFVRATVPADVRARLASRPRRPGRCVALDTHDGDDGDGRCAIYEARPLVCRSHGVPIRMGPDVLACHLNFTARGPAAADADCILDQTTLSTVLATVDAAYVAESGRGPEEPDGIVRVDLREALAP
jgi:hypothetical protein